MAKERQEYGQKVDVDGHTNRVAYLCWYVGSFCDSLGQSDGWMDGWMGNVGLHWPDLEDDQAR